MINKEKLLLNCKDLHIDSLYIEENRSLDKIIDSNYLHELRSCSKILVAMAIGICIENGIFKLDSSIYEVIKDLVNCNNSNLEKIKKWTVKDLLLHKSGYDKIILTSKDISELNLDKEKLLDYLFSLNINNNVGEKYIYNNVEPFILSVYFQELTKQNLGDFIKEHIFDKLEIIEYKCDNYGKYYPGCTGLYLYPNDFHKLGKLLLNEGKYNNYQVIPRKWAQEMCKLQIYTDNYYKKERVLPKIGAGYFTFISRDGYVFRDGSNGQYLIINKGKNILISIMSSEKDMSKITEIFRNII